MDSKELSAGSVYTFPSDPQAEILQWRLRGGYGSTPTEVILFGDGRLEKTVGRGGQAQGREEVRLEYVEMDDLVRLCVEGGLMDWAGESVSERAFQALVGDREILGGGIPTSSDDATITVRIRLASYRSPSGDMESPAVSELQYSSSLGSIRRRFKEGFSVREIDAVLALQKRLISYFDAAGEGER